MQNITLFGSRSHRAPLPKQKKKYRFRTFLIVLLSLVVLGEGVYFWLCSTDNAFVSKWRTIYIQTAMSTLTHQWLATDLLPEDVVNDAIELMNQGLENQIGQNSSWDIPEQEPEKPVEPEEPPVEDIPVEEDTRPYWIKLDPEGAEAFFELFWEIEQESMLKYLDTHPEAMDNGWANINIDEAGLDQDGTSITTINGDQVLGINAHEEILLIRVTGSTYRGVLAIAKDPARLGMRWSAGIGSYGQTCKAICERNDAILGISASGFDDPNGMGNGGILSGYAMCNGDEKGHHALPGYKRLELHEDNRMYITDARDYVGKGTTDAVEFTPALIVDSRVIVDETCDWTGMHPRAIMGQNELGEVQMLVIEGRQPGLSLGVSVVDCAHLLSTYRCAQAMNMDGGTTAMMYYNGRSIISCSNTVLEDGRALPNAWCYFSKDTFEE